MAEGGDVSTPQMSVTFNFEFEIGLSEQRAIHEDCMLAQRRRRLLIDQHFAEQLQRQYDNELTEMRARSGMPQISPRTLQAQPAQPIDRIQMEPQARRRPGRSYDEEYELMRRRIHDTMQRLERRQHQALDFPQVRHDPYNMNLRYEQARPDPYNMNPLRYEARFDPYNMSPFRYEHVRPDPNNPWPERYPNWDRYEHGRPDPHNPDRYELFHQIADRMGPARPTGMKPAELAQLPKRRFRVRDPRNREAKTCHVCLNDWKSGENVTSLPCFHEFHTKCIGDWLKINKTCPVCRAEVKLPDQ